MIYSYHNFLNILKIQGNLLRAEQTTKLMVARQVCWSESGGQCTWLPLRTNSCTSRCVQTDQTGRLIILMSVVEKAEWKEQHESVAPPDLGPLPGLASPGSSRQIHVRCLRGWLGLLHHAVQSGAVHHQGPVRQVTPPSSSSSASSTVFQGQCLYGEKEDPAHSAPAWAREDDGDVPATTDWTWLSQLLDFLLYILE